MFVGSPNEVIDKIPYEHELFGHQRFLVQFSVGPMQYNVLMRSIELFGTMVAPAVRKALEAGGTNGDHADNAATS